MARQHPRGVSGVIHPHPRKRKKEKRKKEKEKKRKKKKEKKKKEKGERKGHLQLRASIIKYPKVNRSKLKLGPRARLFLGRLHIARQLRTRPVRGVPVTGEEGGGGAPRVIVPCAPDTSTRKPCAVARTRRLVFAARNQRARLGRRSASRRRRHVLQRRHLILPRTQGLKKRRSTIVASCS